MADVISAVHAHCDAFLQTKFQQAVDRVKRTLDIYGFNGGKDSTVVLHILRAAIASHAANDTTRGALANMHTFFFSRPDDFDQVVDFVHHANSQYGLQMRVIDGDFKTGLEQFVSETGVQAIFIGTRRGDPNAGDQEIWCPSSAGWPPFMRVNPVLDWAYPDVWAFLRGASLPYCSLYDEGYTSLGGTSNTQRNSALERADGTYAPAHCLADSRLERAGRAARIGKTPSSERVRHGTAALLIIGDELLRGRVADVNTPFLCRSLHAKGWAVMRAVVLPDDVGAISTELRACSEAYDVVITAGGVGPTLDDVTMTAVANALNTQLTRNPDLEACVRKHFNHVTDAHLKLADTPAGMTQVVEYDLPDGRPSPFPLVLCGGNVYVLPGVPHLLQQKWKAVEDHLTARSQMAPFKSVSFRLSLIDEPALAPVLDAVAQEAGSGVCIGSYPVSQQEDGACVLLCLESKHEELLKGAHDELLARLPPESVLDRTWSDQ